MGYTVQYVTDNSFTDRLSWSHLLSCYMCVRMFENCKCTGHDNTNLLIIIQIQLILFLNRL